MPVIDFLPQCLGPLPAKVAACCSKYMDKHNIKQFYNARYDANSPEFWKKLSTEACPKSTANAEDRGGPR